MSGVQVNLPEQTLARAKELAAEDHVTLDGLLAAVVDQEAESCRRSAQVRAWAEQGRDVDIRAILAQSPDVPPVPGDEID